MLVVFIVPPFGPALHRSRIFGDVGEFWAIAAVDWEQALEFCS